MAKKEIEKAAENEVKQKEATIVKKDLGKAKTKTIEQKEEAKQLAEEFGYKKIPLSVLPTKGMFYPVGTEIALRAANVNEIRHWSTIDEEDELAVDDLLNFIIKACVKIKIPGKHSHYKDLKELDRFFLIFAIREFTFKDGENKLFAEIPDPGNSNRKEKIEVTKDIIKYFEPSEKLLRFYDEESRGFKFKTRPNSYLEMSIPSLGITGFIKDYSIMKQQKREGIDSDFLQFAPFIIKEWRGLTDSVYEKEELMKSYDWNLKEISVISDVYEEVKRAINPEMNVKFESGREATVPLTFLGGLKALFIIPDILDELD